MVTETSGNPVIMTGNGYGDCGMGGGSWIWAFLIFALLGNGNFAGNGRYGREATVGDVQRGFDTQDINGQLRGITYGQADSTYAIANAVNTGFANLARDVSNEGRSTQAQIASCCCENLRANDAVRFDMANYVAQINANVTAQNQKVLDALCQNKIEAMQAQINELQLKNAVAGVVRYPNGMTYNAGTSPFCGNGSCGYGSYAA